MFVLLFSTLVEETYKSFEEDENSLKTRRNLEKQLKKILYHLCVPSNLRSVHKDFWENDGDTEEKLFMVNCLPTSFYVTIF